MEHRTLLNAIPIKENNMNVFLNIILAIAVIVALAIFAAIAFSIALSEWGDFRHKRAERLRLDEEIKNSELSKIHGELQSMAHSLSRIEDHISNGKLRSK